MGVGGGKGREKVGLNMNLSMSPRPWEGGEGKGGNPSTNCIAGKGIIRSRVRIGKRRCPSSVNGINRILPVPNRSDVSLPRPMVKGKVGVANDVPVMRANKMAGSGFPLSPAFSVALPFPLKFGIRRCGRIPAPHLGGLQAFLILSPSSRPSRSPSCDPRGTVRRREGEGGCDCGGTERVVRGGDVDSLLAWAASLFSSAGAPGFLRGARDCTVGKGWGGTRCRLSPYLLSAAPSCLRFPARSAPLPLASVPPPRLRLLLRGG